MTTPILGAPELVESQAIPATTTNEMFRFAEQGARWFAFIDETATPPGSPADGDCYLVGAGATGAWDAQDGKIAFFMNTAWEFVTPSEGMGGYFRDTDTATVYDGAAWTAIGGGGGAGSQSVTFALSDLTSDLATGASQGYWDPPFPITVSAVSASVLTAPTGSGISVDINEEGVSILSTVITIDATEVRSIDSATPPVVSDVAITGRLTFDIDAVGSTTTGNGLQVTIEYTEA